MTYPSWKKKHFKNIQNDQRKEAVNKGAWATTVIQASMSRKI